MAGETDLTRMLATLDVEQRPGRWVVVTGDWPTLADDAAATIDEAEGTTLIVPAEAARAVAAPFDGEFAWLTLTVHSSLHAVGLTAAFSRALAAAGIPCNVLAGFHHDHLLVPVTRAADAVTVLRALSSC